MSDKQLYSKLLDIKRPWSVVGDWGERRLHGCKEVEQRRSSCRVQPTQ